VDDSNEFKVASKSVVVVDRTSSRFGTDVSTEVGIEVFLHIGDDCHASTVELDLTFHSVLWRRFVGEEVDRVSPATSPTMFLAEEPSKKLREYVQLCYGIELLVELEGFLCHRTEVRWNDLVEGIDSSPCRQG
jgi:hypothetical protein